MDISEKSNSASLFKKTAATIKRIIRNLGNRAFWRYGLITRLSKIFYPKAEGFDVNSEDWNYLIILDACRYDVFAEEIAKRKIEGKLEHRISKGAMTAEFLDANFGKGQFDDIVYITANPFVNVMFKNKFHKLISVWINGWDSELNTVRPEKVYDTVLSEHHNYPGKKFIIHFMQPHPPFLTMRFPDETGIQKFRDSVINNAELQGDIGPWRYVIRKKIPAAKVIEGYKENLKIVMDYVEKLIPHLSGKIVITADHGEGFGEPLHRFFPIKVYGHPNRARIESIVKVPWFVINKQENS